MSNNPKDQFAGWDKVKMPVAPEPAALCPTDQVALVPVPGKRAHNDTAKVGSSALSCSVCNNQFLQMLGPPWTGEVFGAERLEDI